MNKNKEWLKEQIGFHRDATEEPSFNEYTKGLNYAYGTVDDLIDQLDESGKVVIPKFVADWIEDKKFTRKGSPITAIWALYENKEPYDVCSWVTRNQEDFMEAYTNDYIVEQEKRYRLKLIAPILISNDEVFLNFNLDDDDYAIDTEKEGVFYKTIFTESELSQMDETGFTRIPVKEEDEC